MAFSNPRRDEFKALVKRAIELGSSVGASDYVELLELLKSEFPAVRKSAANALAKRIGRQRSLAGVCKVDLIFAAREEKGPQTLNFMLRALIECAVEFNRMDFDYLRDIVRNPNWPQYVRDTANDAIYQGELLAKDREGVRRHWCTRCRKSISAEEAKTGIAVYGMPYCHHCLKERQLEDINFEMDVEKAKRLRTTDEVAVQSRGEQRIGDWLAAHRIAYRYDERIILAGDIRIRPDFYLPEFDLYIEYWGMDTPEYLENMRKKRILYQRDRKKLISISYKDFDKIESELEFKLSRYIPNL